MKKTLLFGLIALISLTAFAANTRKWVTFVDENGKKRTDLTAVTIYDQNTETLSSVYATTDNTVAVTNPMTTTSTNTGINAAAGEVIFWSEANTYDLQVTVGGVVFRLLAVQTVDRQFLIPVFATGTVVGSEVSNTIWVSKYGSDTVGSGTMTKPYLTISHAFSVVTATRKTILVMPGDYEDVLVWPDTTGVVLRAPYGAVRVTSDIAIPMILDISPTYTASIFEATLDGIGFESEIAQKTVVIDNTSMTKKLNVYIKNCIFSGEVTDDSVRVTHGSADNAIRVYVDGSGEVWEGIVTFVCANTGDRLRIKNQILLGGITTTGDVAGEIFLQNTGILTSGITIDNDHKLTTIGCWYQTDADPTVYTNCANAFATY